MQGSRRSRRVACVCHVSLSIALSPLLHFVPKFSIQKIKGGEKDE